MKTLGELMDSGDFVIHADDELNDVKVDYSEEFEDWFEKTIGEQLTQDTLTRWFNDTLREALDQYSEAVSD